LPQFAEARELAEENDGYLDRPMSSCSTLCRTALLIQSAQRPIHQSDPISSSCSRSIEAFPELRQRCGTHDFPAPALINAALTAKADFNFA
jgi:hypothetical protein